MVVRLPALAPLLLVAVLLAGCGKSDDGGQIKDLVERQAQANRTKSYTRVCADYSERARSQVASAARLLGAKGTDCATQLAALRAVDEDPAPAPSPGSMKVTDLEVSGDRATARVSPIGPNADPVAHFVREDDDWKVDAPAP